MIKDTDVYKIGRVGKPHGVKGEVQVQIDDDVFDRVGADYLVLRIDGILVPFFMEEYRFKSDEIALVTFCDMDSAEKVRELTGCEVFSHAHLPTKWSTTLLMRSLWAMSSRTRTQARP